MKVCSDLEHIALNQCHEVYLLSLACPIDLNGNLQAVTWRSLSQHVQYAYLVPIDPIDYCHQYCVTECTLNLTESPLGQVVIIRANYATTPPPPRTHSCCWCTH